MTRTSLAALMVAFPGVLALHRAENWGASPDEIAAALPGDDLVPDPADGTTADLNADVILRHGSIDPAARANRVWAAATLHGRVVDVPNRDAEIRILDADECYELLKTQQIGRLGVNAEHYPLIFPVNYGIDDGVIVIRTDEGTKLSAVDHANVTFEVDAIDSRTRSGWSVLVRGLAEEVTKAFGTRLIESTHAAGVEPWAPGERGRWLRLIPHAISGRRIVPGELPPAFESEGYL